MVFKQLPTTHTAGGTGHLSEHDELARSYNRLPPILPPPDPDPSVNVLNLNAFYTALAANGIGGLVIPARGVYRVNDTIVIRNVRGLHYLGSLQTVFQWVGDDATKPIFRLAHCNHCVFDGLNTLADGAALGHVHLLRDNLLGATLTPSHNRLLNCEFDGRGHTKYGVLIGGAGAIDANNEFNSCDHVKVSGYLEAGFYAPNSQAYGTLFTNCSLSGWGVGKFGVDTGGVGASIHWISGSFDAHTEADLRLGRTAQAHLIDGAQSENSARFLDLTQDGRHQVYVRGMRWMANALHEDGKMIKCAQTTHLTLDTCTLGGGTEPTRAATIELLNGAQSTASSIRVLNTAIVSSAEGVFLGDTQYVHIEGSYQMTSEAPAQYRALTA